jgi:hypothetical protein
LGAPKNGRRNKRRRIFRERRYGLFPPSIVELRRTSRFARNDDLEVAAATKRPDGQISKMLSRHHVKNIALKASGKSVA